METTNQEVQDMVEKFTSMLSHIRDTFINASALAEKVAQLEAKVNEMTASVEHYTNQIRSLDELVVTLRSERDGALSEKAQAQSAHSQIFNEHEALKSTHSILQSDFNRVEAEREEYRYARDEANMEIRRLSDELEVLRKKHADFVQHVEGLWKAVNPQPRDPQSGQFGQWPQVVTG